MANRAAQSLTRARKCLLAGAGVAAVAIPIAIGVGHAPALRAQSRAATPQGARSTEKPLAFDTSSVKPYRNSGGGGRNGGAGGGPPRGGGGLRFSVGRIVSAPAGVTARKAILEAYHLSQYELSGGPDWLDSDRFEIEGRADTPANEGQLRQMLQTLLAERFKLAVHRETREMAVFALLVGKNGTKLHEWKEGDPMPEFGSGGHANNFRDRGTMQRLADVLSGGPSVDRPVLDKTGLKGVYVFYVEWDEDQEFLPAMQQAFGLRLESQKAPMDVVVIDRIEKPSEN